MSILGGKQGFEICAFKKNGDLVANLVTGAGNILGNLANNLRFLLGKCFCRHDCNPPQLVCRDPSVLELLTGFDVNIENKAVQLIYKATEWNVFCYCPEFVEKGKNPCEFEGSPKFCTP